MVKPSINDIQPEEKDEAKTSSTGRQHPKVFFVNEDGDVLSVYRSVLYSVKVISCSFFVKGYVNIVERRGHRCGICV